jgi:hypothetical protein
MGAIAGNVQLIPANPLQKLGEGWFQATIKVANSFTGTAERYNCQPLYLA